MAQAIYKKENFNALGVNMQNALLEKAGAIISGDSPKVEYNKKCGKVELQFNIDRDEVLIDKTVTSDCSAGATTHIKISVQELKDNFKKKYGEEVYKILTVSEIKDSKAIKKMTKNSVSFNQKVEDMLSCEDSEKQMNMILDISKNVANYKQNPEAWILAANEVNWDEKAEEQTEKEPALATA